MKFLLLLLALNAHAELSPSARHADLRELRDLIAADYGPLEFKREKFGLDLDALTASYDGRVENGDDDAFRYLLKQYIGEFHDSHFGARVKSGASAGLGFTTDLFRGRVVIDSIDRTRLPAEKFPFQIGDEITSFDGEPALKAGLKVSSYLGMGTAAAQERLGAMFLTNRQARIVPLPSGSAEVEIAGRSVTLPWIVEEQVAAPAPRLLGGGNWCSPISSIKMPAGSEPVTGVSFTAFTFPTPRGRVGFLRIPDYYPVDALGNEIAAQRFAEYERVVADFEKNTVGLVIDQNHNCGGSVVYLYKMVSLFAGSSFDPARIELRASQTQIDGLQRQLDRFTPAESGYAQLKAMIEGVKAALTRGAALTPALPLRGFMEVKLPLPGGDRIDVNPVHYTKPIVLLVDELAGSGGDLFPSMMQDLGRARLFGHTTMGAGGHVWDDPHLSLKNSGLDINLTRSLLVRLNGGLIENEGVSPDVPYTLSVNDLLDGYSTYLSRAAAEL